jgi:hypothetical protein
MGRYICYRQANDTHIYQIVTKHSANRIANSLQAIYNYFIGEHTRTRKADDYDDHGLHQARLRSMQSDL